MTSSRLFSGRLVAAVAALACAPTLISAQSDLRETFDRGIELLRDGDREGALAQFQRVLAEDPGHEAAYQLWKETDHRAWLDLLTERGEFELIGKRLMDLARLGREDKSDDSAEISALVQEVFGGDVVARRRAVIALGSRHGEFAVPRFLGALADESSGDKRVLAIHALTEMGPTVVLPLVQALRSDDAFLRTQVAFTLGHIGDRRSAPVLAWHAGGDPNSGVASACADAIARMGASSDALAGFLALGDAYRSGDPSALAPGLRSRVVWSWDGKLKKRAVPSGLYADELAKGAYYDALAIDPSSVPALAGIAAASASQIGVLEARARGGADVSDLLDQARAGLLAVSAAGTEAVDSALQHALDLGDQVGAAALARVLGDIAGGPTRGLERAREAGGAVRAEAALALAHTALRGGGGAGAPVIDALATAASREIFRVAGIIDADVQRTSVVRGELEGRGVLVRSWDKGAVALASMRRAPGFDVLIVGESLPDLTVHQVIGEIQGDDRISKTPLLMSATDGDTADELYGNRVAGIITTSDLSALDAALSGELTGERAAAAELAARAAHALARLSALRVDLIPVQGLLIGALDREDRIAMPIAHALGRAGDQNAVTGLVGIVADDARSTEVRVAAADALAGIFTRQPGSGLAVADTLAGVATGDGEHAVRFAATRALGQLDLDPSWRAGLMNDVRSALGE